MLRLSLLHRSMTSRDDSMHPQCVCLVPPLGGLPQTQPARDHHRMNKRTDRLNEARRQLDLLTAFGAAVLVAVLVYAVYTVA